MNKVLQVSALIFLFGISGWSQKQPAPVKPIQSALSPEEIFKRVSPSIFVVESLDSEGSVLALGSGVAIELPIKGSGTLTQTTPYIVVVTNKHVIYGAAAYRVRKGEKTWKATLVRLDQERDLCALQPGAGWTASPIPIRRSSNVKIGERVYAIGAPEGLELTLSEGLVSGLRDFENVHLVQTSAAISHGSSGGGLFDSEGRLVGITTFFLKEGQNLNFALPGEWILELAEESAAHFPAAASGSQLEEAKKWADKGFSAYLSEKYQVSVDAYKQAVRLDPLDATTWYRLGEAQLELKKDEEALKSFQESVRLKEDDALPWQRMVVTYVKLHRYDEAIAAANQDVSLEGDSPMAWTWLAIAYSEAGKYSEAADAAQVWVLLDPDNSRSWALLGVAQMKEKQLGEAVSSLEQAVSLAPGNTSVLYNLGLAYSKQGNQPKVAEIVARLQRLNPSLAKKLLQETTPH